MSKIPSQPYTNAMNLPYSTAVRLKRMAKYLEIPNADLIEFLLDRASVPKVPDSRIPKLMVQERWTKYLQELAQHGKDARLEQYFHNEEEANDN